MPATSLLAAAAAVVLTAGGSEDLEPFCRPDLIEIMSLPPAITIGDDKDHPRWIIMLGEDGEWGLIQIREDGQQCLLDWGSTLMIHNDVSTDPPGDPT